MHFELERTSFIVGEFVENCANFSFPDLHSVDSSIFSLLSLLLWFGWFRWFVSSNDDSLGKRQCRPDERWQFWQSFPKLMDYQQLHMTAGQQHWTSDHCGYNTLLLFNVVRTWRKFVFFIISDVCAAAVFDNDCVDYFCEILCVFLALRVTGLNVH